ncbi:type VI secretion system tip protein VgrG [Pseudescherichia vulneris]|uniref:type VI secretion system Vgr family protein n=1 Tax=Pseudescherichia vulneris TaxID=566 RepID=UPI00227CB3DC|nr:type VI secretion system Vgr family protein [Pseudescherichia vulneris]WAH53096.1 type VI secretion system tip protein VgrG [Pseudescherichia vulneris]
MSEATSLIFSHSHHLLKVRGCQALLDVLCFEGREALSEPFRYTIEFTSTDKALTPQQMLMQDASLTLQAPVDQGFGLRVQQPVRTLQGVVTGFERLSTSEDEAHYALTLQPRLALLARSHQNRIYQDMSVPDIVEHVLRTRHEMRGEDFVFTLANEYPRREQVMQYGEDDLTFISRLLAEVGIWYCVTADTRLNIDVLAFYDDQRYVGQGLTLPSVPPSGQHDSGTESVWALKSRHNVVEKSVFTRDYNYRNAPEDMSLSVDVARGDSTTYGEAYHWADNYLTPGDSDQRDPEPESGAFYARIRHERYLNGQLQLNGVTNCATLAPGQELKVTGGEEVTGTFRQGVVITRIHSRARRDRSFEVTFHAIPFSERYCFRPAEITRPRMAGTLPARVTSTKANDIYGHIDRDGRYRVSLLFDRDRWAPGEESLWVRQSRPYAGDTWGLHLPLLAGTEVAIAFEQGDPDRPYIAGVLHDSAHPDHVTIYNYKRNVLRTPANNKIRLDDTRGREHVKISTEYGGKSQLNLGHLVDSGRNQRGEGFELRTDSHGAVRAGKGLFITADAQPKAQGQQLAMEPVQSRLSAALVEMQSLAASAQQAQALAADVGRQQMLLQHKLDRLQQAVLLCTAPQGVALASGEDMLLSAQENLTLVAGKQLDIGAQKDFTLAAGKQIGLWSQQGAKWIASQGDIDIQAQGGTITTWSTQDTHITSGKKLVITAQDELTLVCGGGYIKIKGGNVETGGPGKLLVKNQGISKQGTASMQGVMKSFEAGSFDEKFALLHPVSKEPIANRRFRLTLPDGSVQEGVTDSQGKTPLVQGKTLGDVIFELVKED